MMLAHRQVKSSHTLGPERSENGFPQWDGHCSLPGAVSQDVSSKSSSLSCPPALVSTTITTPQPPQPIPTVTAQTTTPQPATMLTTVAAGANTPQPLQPATMPTTSTVAASTVTDSQARITTPPQQLSTVTDNLADVAISESSNKLDSSHLVSPSKESLGVAAAPVTSDIPQNASSPTASLNTSLPMKLPLEGIPGDSVGVNSHTGSGHVQEHLHTQVSTPSKEGLHLLRLDQNLGRIDSTSDDEDGLCIACDEPESLVFKDELDDSSESNHTQSFSSQCNPDNVKAKGCTKPTTLSLLTRSSLSPRRSDEGYISGTPHSSDITQGSSKTLPFSSFYETYCSKNNSKTSGGHKKSTKDESTPVLCNRKSEESLVKFYDAYTDQCVEETILMDSKSCLESLSSRDAIPVELDILSKEFGVTSSEESKADLVNLSGNEVGNEMEGRDYNSSPRQHDVEGQDHNHLHSLTAQAQVITTKCNPKR